MVIKIEGEVMENSFRRLSVKSKTVWMIQGVITAIFTFIGLGGLIWATLHFDWPRWIIVTAAVFCVLEAFVVIYLSPKLQWEHFYYEIREQEVEIQRGIFVIKKTLIPMVRVQHVDVKQGPILKKYGLSTLTISTAATVHEIPALEEDIAEEIRHAISKLVKADEEDV